MPKSLVQATSLTLLLAAAASMAQGIGPDPACTISQSWNEEKNPQTDTVGTSNITYPDPDNTLWYRWVNEGTSGNRTPATINGQFTASRYMSLSIYDEEEELDSIKDTDIDPDPGQNNPFPRPGRRAPIP